jgi:hypothetical protein
MVPENRLNSEKTEAGKARALLRTPCEFALDQAPAGTIRRRRMH